MLIAVLGFLSDDAPAVVEAVFGAMQMMSAVSSPGDEALTGQVFAFIENRMPGTAGPALPRWPVRPFPPAVFADVRMVKRPQAGG
ncbi:hypothetical protein [Streptomyces sp. DSM 40750]|uniref:hypothetical protein n=1 Tax=Streptomyces sp. DSM 40750 TaxID=2801030 RepID=UPI00214C52AA|nr:hypothetical protein [Streptomyces sp. DSM 40750]UUU19116.1 hypothetical protein JIX55_01535 [Streptomyces sp. DSM 40750]UUU27540.1 hypothetical protein JIX55_49210 [Streptomyces sp. DSM 40750]